ncbi:MAG: hydantoinase B/oxoprolinase family protein [Proteobacteria bacterium]|nr:hydantoinase B/oxoprolinase family protein [Pseudomonadota bacterium]
MNAATDEAGTRVYRAAPSKTAGASDADPVTTEILRHALNSAANQMRRALVRTAFSPTIYEVLDFAAAIYDREIRMLAQTPTLPLFMGTMNFCIEFAVEAVGGAGVLEPGDIILYNDPFGTGSHQQDVALIMPVYLSDGGLIGYTAIKAHIQDIGGKDPYSTDTVDVLQEGTIFPGLRLYRRGKRVDDIHRLMIANTRFPKYVIGDVDAMVVGVRAGAAELVRLVELRGRDVFEACVERMFDHGEALIRSYFEKIPDGRYVGYGRMDNNGVDKEPIPFELALEVEGSTVRVDYSKSPPMQGGPVNCPIASTVSATRMAIMMIAGGGDMATEGHFRPVEVITRPGTMFDAQWPAPTFLYFLPAMQAMEVIWRAMSEAMPEAVPASSNGDIVATVWWGQNSETGEGWAEGMPHMGGQGGHAGGDGCSTLMHIMESATRNTPCEVFESRAPWLIEKFELAPDSCGPGKFRSGLGLDMHYTMLDDSWVTIVIDRHTSKPWGLAGGGEGSRVNLSYLRGKDGQRTLHTKVTRLKVEKGATLEILTGGGGGFGPPSERAVDSVLEDLREGYITESHARQHYPHAFAGSSARSAAE